MQNIQVCKKLMAKACLGAFFYVAKGNGLGKQYKLTCLSYSICKSNLVKCFTS